jgi:hypothetical protein
MNTYVADEGEEDGRVVERLLGTAQAVAVVVELMGWPESKSGPDLTTT